MAEVTFFGAPVDALLVREDALVRTPEGLTVNLFVPDSDNPQSGSIRTLPVETGLSDVRGDVSQIEIKAEGLVAGMQVVTDGTERLVPFQPVKLKQESPGGDQQTQETR